MEITGEGKTGNNGREFCAAIFLQENRGFLPCQVLHLHGDVDAVGYMNDLGKKPDFFRKCLRMLQSLPGSVMQKNSTGKLLERRKIFDEQIAIDGVGQNIIGVKLQHL